MNEQQRLPLLASGLVEIYDIGLRKWVQRSAIDAREYLNRATGSLEGPTVQASKGDDVVMICPEQAPHYRADGFECRRVGSSAAIAEPAPTIDPITTGPPSAANPENDGLADELEEFTVVQLRFFAKSVDVAGASQMTKTQLVAELIGVGFRLTTELIDGMPS